MEPMTLGSPTLAAENSPYLPSFLTGETASSLSPRSNTLSPTKRKTLSFASPCQLPSPNTTDYNTSILTGPKTFFGQQQQQQNVTQLANSGPPTQGLFDSLREEMHQIHTPKKSILNQSQAQNICSTPTGIFGSSTINNQSFNESGFNTSRITSPISPSTLNNSNNYGTSNLRSLNVTNNQFDSNLSCVPNKYAEFWITVFGFPQSATQLILTHFSQCGSIVDKIFPPQNGNWIHIRFSSRLECDKALNYNEKILNNNIMIGVTRCKDSNIIDKENLNDNCNQIFKIRPLSQVAYKAQQCETSVLACPPAPKRSSGLVDKAMDLLFGW